MNKLLQLLQAAKLLYGLDHFECKQVAGHDGGRNLVYVCLLNEEKKYVLRISALGDRTEADYLAEAEYLGEIAARFPRQIKRVGARQVPDLINDTYKIMQERKRGKANKSERLFLMIFGMDSL
jgi:hypothetical protein